MSKKLLEMKWVLKEVDDYIPKMVEEERNGQSEKLNEQDNLMSVLLKASDSGGRNGRSDKEIVGNLFIYNVAGHDTYG
jgi:cytochrome P450